MILYLDTSSLLKLYLDEDHSDLVQDWSSGAEVLCTSRVTYPEAMAAVARRRRLGDLGDDEFNSVRQALADDWPTMSSVDLNEEAAAELAVRLDLRGFDAVHLAAAVEVAVASEAPTFFTSFDRQLNRAAKAEGLAVLDAESDLYPLSSVASDSSEVHEPGSDYPTTLRSR